METPIIKDSDIPDDLIPQLRENANYVVYTKEEVDEIRERVKAVIKKLREKNQQILNFNLNLQKKNVEFEFQIKSLSETTANAIEQAEKYKEELRQQSVTLEKYVDKCAELESRLKEIEIGLGD